MTNDAQTLWIEPKGFKKPIVENNQRDIDLLRKCVCRVSITIFYSYMFVPFFGTTNACKYHKSPDTYYFLSHIAGHLLAAALQRLWSQTFDRQEVAKATHPIHWQRCETQSCTLHVDFQYGELRPKPTSIWG